MTALRPQNDAALVPGPESAASLETLYRDHAPYVFRVLAALGVRPADVPDVVHNVFLTAQRRLPTVIIQCSRRAWLHGIAVRTAANYRREARHKHEPYDALPERPGTSSEPCVALDLLQALATLDDDQRAVFVLYEVEELSMPEVAAALGCPLTTAYSRLYAARKLIRGHFARDDEGGRR